MASGFSTFAFEMRVFSLHVLETTGCPITNSTIYSYPSQEQFQAVVHRNVPLLSFASQSNFILITLSPNRYHTGIS